MNKQLKKPSWRSIGFIFLALLGLPLAASPSHGQETQTQEDEVFMGGEVPLSRLSGKRIDRDWFRYENGRFGLAIDIPARGYRYTIPINGSGVAVTSDDEKITMTILAHFTINNAAFSDDPHDPDAFKNAASAVRRVYEHQVAGTLAEGDMTITYRAKKKYFYVVAGHYKGPAGEDKIYYDRYTVSPNCPHVFSSARITYPRSKERELGKFVTRTSRSLRSTCSGEDAKR